MENNKILLGHRIVNGKNTGGIFEPDSWCLPGGKQEYDETIFECATREVKEETNLKVWNLEVFSAIDDIQPNKHFVTIQMITKNYSGDIKIMEPDKQDQWKLFSLDNLPERIYSPSKKFIDAYIVKNQKGDKEL
jgi:8-oxo-dGTP diphosphatase